MKILVTGSKGSVGRCVCRNLISEGYTVFDLPNSSEFDLSNSHQVNEYFKDREFDVVIHLATRGGSRLIKYPWSIVDENLSMYYNLFSNRNRYKKLLSFGSGAELRSLDEPYAYSKSVIRKSILNNEKFHNLRIYNSFDENELDTRFIKSNILNYINKKPIRIYEDKFVDFMYTEDVYKIIKKYIEQESLEKEIDCVYSEKYKLSDVANIINGLEDHRVDVIIDKSESFDDYIGTIYPKNLDFIGLKEGIRRVYNKLKI